MLRFCTFTGVGNDVDLRWLFDLSTRFPFIEWGVLYSPERAGRDPRFPTLEWIQDFAGFCQRHGLNSALHLCGEAAKATYEAPADMELELLTSCFARVQVNAKIGRRESAPLEGRHASAIVQWDDRDPPHARATLTRWARNGSIKEVLYDCSGGRGIRPPHWPSAARLGLPEQVRLGYAGGIGPDNVTEVLETLFAINPGEVISIDLESSLFADGAFSLAICEQVASLVQAACERHYNAAGAAHQGPDRAIETLDGLWLDWWVARSQRMNAAIPAPDARQVDVLDRRHGLLECFAAETLLLELCDHERVRLEPLNGKGWRAQALGGFEWEPGETLTKAALRAVVAKHFGTHVPGNPALVGYACS